MSINKNDVQLKPFFEILTTNIDSQILMEFSDGAVLVLSYFSDSEDDNGLEFEDPDYDDYWSIYFNIDKVIKNGENKSYTSGKIFVLNYHTLPIKFQIYEDVN